VTGAPPPAEQNQLVITVKHDGIYLNSLKVNSPQELTNQIGAQMAGRAAADKVVFINSEDQLAFDQAVIAMDAAHQGGATKIGFLTDPPK
jgi:biopolymer transport protein ExbD